MKEIERHTACTKEWRIDISLFDNGENGYVAKYIVVQRKKAAVNSIAGKNTWQEIPYIDSSFEDSLEGENKDELLKICKDKFESEHGKIIKFDGKLTE